MKVLPKLSPERWNTLFAAIQAICIILATGLAFYGYFFTSLPETIMSQFRSEIVQAREELIDLRRERRDLQGELTTLQDRLKSVNALLEARGREISILERKSALTKTQLR